MTLTQTSARALTATFFVLEPLEGQTFAGYTADQQWNGWACPYFTKDQGQRIVEAWHACGFKADYDPIADVFRFAPFDPQADPTADLGDEEAAEQFQAVEADGMTLYRIGTGTWVWETVTES